MFPALRFSLPYAIGSWISVLSGCTSDDASGPGTTPIDGIGPRAVFVVNGGDASISVLDATPGTLVGEIALHGVSFPHHVYLDAPGDRLFVAAPGVDLSGGHAGAGGEHGGHGGAPPDEGQDPADAFVLVLAADSGELLASRELSRSNHNAIPSPDGTEVWTSQAGTPGAVLILDADTLDELDRIPVGDDPAEVTFAVDGRSAFVCNSGSASVSVIDVQARTVVVELSVGMTPVGAWPGSDGNMYVDNEGARTLSVIASDSLQIVATVDLGFTPAIAAVAPNGELWVTDSDAGRVVAFDRAALGGGPVRTFVAGAGAHALAFSPDGARAFVTNQVEGTVSVIDVETGEMAGTLDVGDKPNGLAARRG